MKIDPNDPASPRACAGHPNNAPCWHYHPSYDGLTIRAEFAKAAMQALLCSPRDSQFSYQVIAASAVVCADALITELNKEEK